MILYNPVIVNELKRQKEGKFAYIFCIILKNSKFADTLAEALYQRLNMELDLQSLFGLHMHSRTHWLRLRNPPPCNPSPTMGLYMRALLVSQDKHFW